MLVYSRFFNIFKILVTVITMAFSALATGGGNGDGSGGGPAFSVGDYCDFGSSPGYDAAQCAQYCTDSRTFNRSIYRTRCCSRNDVCYSSNNPGDSNYGGCQPSWCPSTGNNGNNNGGNNNGGNNNGGNNNDSGAGSGSVAETNSVLSDEPLFTSIDVDPNVFFELDNSTSMDMEVLTVPYFHACSYDKLNPIDSTSGECTGQRISNGYWLAVDYFPNSEGFWRFRNTYYMYIFNNSDKAIGRSNATLDVSAWLSGNGLSGESLDRYNAGYDQWVTLLDWRVRSSSFNVTYYNPKVNYKPWVDSTFPRTNTTKFSQVEASYTAAKSNPVSGLAGYNDEKNLNDLTTSLSGNQPFVFEVWLDNAGFSGEAPSQAGLTNRTTTDNRIVDLWDEHVKYTVTSTGIDWLYIGYEVDASGNLHLVEKNRGRLGLDDVDNLDFDGDGTIDGSGKKTSDVIKNIANWYQYGRKRTYAARSAIATVVDQSPTVRFALGYIKKEPEGTYLSGGFRFNNRVDFPARSVTDYTDHNNRLLEDLYYSEYDDSGSQDREGTPLRYGLRDVGRYYETTAGESAASSPIIEACQHNFAVLFTDGHYNDLNLSFGTGDVDGDGSSDMLADIAREYYTRDLNTSLDNRVVRSDHPDANSESNEVYQHMVTFPVSFGLEGLLVDSNRDGLPNLKYDLADNELDPFEPSLSANWATLGGGREDPAKIDDMWHAAYNSGGLFISASTPEQLVDGLETIIDVVDQTTASSSALAASSGEVRSGSLVFQVFFDSSNWSGNVKAIQANEQGEFVNDYWTNDGANGPLDAMNQNSRVMITRTNAGGVPFRWANLSAAQKTLLNDDENLLLYLRGDRTKEGANGYRARDHLLGDIISSAPFFVGAPFETYPSNLNGSGAASYQSFRNAHGDTRAQNGTVTYGRKRMIYTAANDGILHGFSVDENGKELLAYIPSMVYPKLKELSYRDYKHRYILDGAPIVADAYSSRFGGAGGGWKSVLVAGMGAGGAGIYALDVTDPSNFSESSASQIVMWEFTRTNTAPNNQPANGDSDLGYTFGIPSIAMMNDGTWVAVFGNGFHNNELGGDGSAAIYIVDIATGGLIRKFDTPNTYRGGKNGMASPALIDVNGDYKIDYIYAGDLAGNVWKLDVTDSEINNWKFAFGSNTSPQPLFTAETGQQITTRPDVMRHPTGRGFMVLFGTGKFMDNGDNSATGQTTQSFYGVWDKNLSSGSHTTITPANLLEQVITYEGTHTFTSGSGNSATSNTVGIRVTSDESDNARYKINWETHKGWKLNFEYSGNNGNLGERQVTNAVVRDGSILFTTILPTPEACTPGGSSWLMELDAADGSRLGYPPFDLNGDNRFDDSDRAYGNSYDGQSSSGVSKPQQGIYSAPLNLPNKLTGSEGCVDSTLLSTSEGNILDFSRACVGSKGRQSWRYLNID